MSRLKFLDKESDRILSRQSSFFSVVAPDDIEDKHFDTAEAIEILTDGLRALLPDLGDIPLPEQIDTINRLYTEFEAEVGGDANALEKKVKALQLENGRLKAQIKRFKEESDK